MHEAKGAGVPFIKLGKPDYSEPDLEVSEGVAGEAIEVGAAPGAEASESDLSSAEEETTTITLYVQKRDSPTEVVKEFIGAKLSGKDPEPDTGHTFITIGEGEDKRSYGFYPGESWFGGTGSINTNEGLFVAGSEDPTDVYGSESDHSWTHSHTFTATPDAAEKLESAIQKDIEAIKNNSDDAPKYNVADLHCTTWAQKHLEAVGLEPPEGFSPYGVAESIEKDASSDTDSENAPK